jgi:2'-5' RNA ligase
MRCFIAIDIDDTIRAGLGDLQRTLAAEADVRKGDVKWVRPEAMHLTLKFLGEIGDQQLVDVCREVGNIAGRHKSFELEVGSVGCFGGRSARVVWVGAGMNCPSLLQLQQDLEHGLEQAGCPRESRRFSGHLTLCRIRNPRAGAKLAKMVESYRDFSLGTVAAASIAVYQSRLMPEGPVYTLLGNYELQ